MDIFAWMLVFFHFDADPPALPVLCISVYVCMETYVYMYVWIFIVIHVDVDLLVPPVLYICMYMYMDIYV